MSRARSNLSPSAIPLFILVSRQRQVGRFERIPKLAQLDNAGTTCSGYLRNLVSRRPRDFDPAVPFQAGHTGQIRQPHAQGGILVRANEHGGPAVTSDQVGRC
ncbi:MAG: hypothetical protein ACOYEV_12460 [Candidatus Nanopelagicales bacterium]